MSKSLGKKKNDSVQHKDSAVAQIHPTDPRIGMIGMGWIGKSYYNEFRNRGYDPIGYSLEKPWINNKKEIAKCDIVFVAVWTPTTPDGFDMSVIRSVLPLVGKGKIAVIKSTIMPGMAKLLQKEFPQIVILFSPEFLSINTAQEDVTYPWANIIGMPVDDSVHRKASRSVLSILPMAKCRLICDSSQAEIVKYAHNISAIGQVMVANMLHDISAKLGVRWDEIKQAMLADPHINNRYAEPVHKSGRGAGGGCFIKDLAAFRECYAKLLPEDSSAYDMLRAMEKKNIELLTSTNKDLDLLRGVYGKNPAEYEPKKHQSAT